MPNTSCCGCYSQRGFASEAGISAVDIHANCLLPSRYLYVGIHTTMEYHVLPTYYTNCHEQSANMSMGVWNWTIHTHEIYLVDAAKVSSAGNAARPDDTALAFYTPAGDATLTVTRGNGLILLSYSLGAAGASARPRLMKPGEKKRLKIPLGTTSVREKEWYAVRYTGVNWSKKACNKLARQTKQKERSAKQKKKRKV